MRFYPEVRTSPDQPASVDSNNPLELFVITGDVDSGLPTVPNFVIGDMLYADTVTSLATFPGNSTNQPKFLRSLGSGTQANAPEWRTLSAVDISDLTTALTGITKVGIVTYGEWRGTPIDNAYIPTLTAAGKVANSATTANSANSNNTIVLRDGSGNFGAGVITSTGLIAPSLSSAAGAALDLKTGTAGTVLSFASNGATATFGGGVAVIVSSSVTASSLTLGGANPAAVGSLKFPNNNVISWRNAANSADLTFRLNASNLFAFDAGITTTTGTFIGILRNDGATGGFALGSIASVARIDFNAAVASTFSFLNASNANAPIVCAGVTATTGTFSGFLKTSSVLVFDTSVGDGATSLPQIYRNDPAGLGSLNFQLGNAAGVFRFINATAGATPFQVTAAGAGTFLAGLTATTGTFNGALITTGSSGAADGSVYLDNTTGMTMRGKAGSSWDLALKSPGGTNLLIEPTGQLKLVSSVPFAMGDTLDVSGALTALSSVRSTSSVGGIGYGTGAGGTVTQSTSKNTPVTINKICGKITTDASNLVAGGWVAFTVNNSNVAIGDVVILSIGSGGTPQYYTATVVYGDGFGSGGSFTIALRNHDTIDRAESVVIYYAIIKAVTS
jgi:hypothetical protein